MGYRIVGDSIQMEHIFCSNILPRLLAQAHLEEDKWAIYLGEDTDCLDLADIGAMRSTSTAWRDFVDAQPEYAAMRLARAETARLGIGRWILPRDFMRHRFLANFRYLSSTWKTTQPVFSLRFRTAPLKELSELELETLVDLLISSSCVEIDIYEDRTLHAPGCYWVTPSLR